MRTYIFETKLLYDKKVVREIEIPEDASLYELAEGINDAYDFGFDHPFGFFDNIKSWIDSTRSYELFADLKGMGIEPTGAKSVKKTTVKQVWENPEDQMLFLFDYGDEWLFVVTLKKFGEKASGVLYPRVVRKKGEAPVQYPMEEDDEEEESS